MPYVPLQDRLYADLDNERVDPDVVGLSQTDFIQNFLGDTTRIDEGAHVYLFMDIVDDNGELDHVVSEGRVIKNPYTFKPYKWCCKLTTEIEYLGQYLDRHRGGGGGHA